MEPFGVYVHVPFCASRCDYCDFATWTDRGHLVDDYVDACVVDVERRFDRRFGRGLPAATSVFFGGGTPSLLPADGLTRVLAAVPRVAGAEVTVECNPDSVDPAKLAAYRAAGVNRVSFGVQSMRGHVLAALGRTHDPANVARAVAWARAAGFDTFNLDLILGTPGETIDDWRATLDAVLELEPPHVSAYALTVEPATPLGRRVAAGAPGPDEDDQAAKYELADDRLAAAGLDWYEISNWARPGHECRHNLLYWAQGDYLAIGCAAHGHTTSHGSGLHGSGLPGSGAAADGSARRWWNVRTPERYVERIRAGRPPESGGEVLDHPDRAEEAFGLALRTRGGAPLDRDARAAAAPLARAGLLEPGPLDAGRAVLTRRGRLLATDVTARLLAAANGRSPAATEGPVAPGWHSVHSSANGSTPTGAGSGNPPGGLFPAAAGADTPNATCLEQAGRPST